MDKRIYLIRHGKIDVGEEKRYIGITDLPLSSEGINQAGQLSEYFFHISIEKVYVSPLIRCVQTSEIIVGSRNIESVLLEELKEINMGDWEGKSFAYIKNRFPEQYENRGKHIDTFIPPGGESFYQLQQRVMPAFESIIRSTVGNVLVIAHAGVNRVILSNFLGLPLQEILNVYQPYGCVNELFWDQTYQRWQCKTVG
ncbi:alpha-ribazole phosphatase [Geosporobacter ferrireducens]|uniref:alpha-ribazole phosphatase n=1 Tax=Geosporobacter ferrireducens TaxID=1424294 RepID=UPI00139ACB80|nr:alpha-ribazole phosphatase [Geosporobacter ferrireducens]MTI57779.1 alpha-ribazole phosphatase [Geosporobacter ferrireducens]